MSNFKICSLAVLSCFAIVTAQECLWNTTHCSCTTGTSAGACLRNIAGVNPAQCNVEQCKAGGYKCDCLGKDLCQVDKCNAWKTMDDSVPTIGAKNVPCKIVSDGNCLTKLEKPVMYKMVQLGAQTEATMFNMTWQKDTDDYITSLYKAGVSTHDMWPAKDSIILRQLNFRLYESADGASKFFCTMYAPEHGQ